MVQPVSEVPAECPHARWESAFIEGVDFSLARDLHRAGMTAGQMMAELMARVGTVFARMHREMGLDTRPCLEKMARQLDGKIRRKVGGIECPTSHALFLYANESSETRQTAELYAHVRGCPECQRDVRQMRAKLPDYERLKNPSLWI